MTTIYASIGNTDDKLTQSKWAEFVGDFRKGMLALADQVYGVWLAEPSSPYQNACIAIETDVVLTLKAMLAAMARDYGQDSIAVATVTSTEFV